MLFPRDIWTANFLTRGEYLPGKRFGSFLSPLAILKKSLVLILAQPFIFWKNRKAKIILNYNQAKSLKMFNDQ